MQTSPARLVGQGASTYMGTATLLRSFSAGPGSLLVGMSCWRASQYKDRKQEFGNILLFAHTVVSDQAHFTNNCTYEALLEIKRAS